MRKTLFFITILSLVFLAGCKQATKQIEETASTEMKESNLAKPSTSWVEERVGKAKERLLASEAGKLVWAAMEKQGGLSTWFENGPIYFRFNYRPLGPGNKIRDTYQTVDTWSAKARHQLADRTEVEYGWDGEKAWRNPADAEMAINPRFWSLSPYFFVGLPFVLGDEGIRLSLEEPASLNGTDYHLVRVTFGEGVGDAPNDYYILYLNKETAQFEALRYIVSFPGFFPNGGNTAEKIMIYEGSQKVKGISLAQNLPTYKWTEGKIGELVTNIAVTDVAFKPEVTHSYFEVPAGSYVLSGYND